MGMKKTISTFITFFALAVQLLDASVACVFNNLETRVKQSQTDALLIQRNGRTVFAHHDGRQFPRMDCYELTRPLLAFAVGFLVDERYIGHLDMPVSTLCPSWNDGPLENVSVRSLLADEGECFFYLNDVIKLITDQEWYDYLQIKLFTPLGIKGDCWSTECDGSVKLRLTALEIAKIAQLIMRKGELNGKQLISRAWIQQLFMPIGSNDPFMGMQWNLEYYDIATYWDEQLLEEYACKGVNSATVNTLRALHGRVVHFGGLAIRGHLLHGWGQDIFCALGGQCGFINLLQEVHKHHLPLGYYKAGSIKLLMAWGRGGQQLIIIPQYNVVAIRQTTHLDCKDTLEDLIEILDNYIREINCYVE